MDGDIHRRRWQHNMLLSIIIAIILFLAVSYRNDIAIKTYQQNHDNDSLMLSIDKVVYGKERMQLNPKLPIHIQNIILDSRRAVYNNYTSSSLLQDTAIGIPSSIRRRRRELYTPTTNCIESYHVSIVPEEVNTCTNSNYYVSYWSISNLLVSYCNRFKLFAHIISYDSFIPRILSHSFYTSLLITHNTASRMVINTTTKIHVPYNINKMLCRNVSTL